MYGNYGRQEDLDVLQKKNVELKGSVMLLRTGKISFAEQVCVDLFICLDYISCFFCFSGTLSLVFMFLITSLQVDNAATKGASAVLIYPDVEDYKYLANTPLYGHVRLYTQLFKNKVACC